MGDYFSLIDSCATPAELVTKLTSDNRYVKLNITNLTKGCKTFEFRAKSCNANDAVALCHWIALISRLVAAASAAETITPMKAGATKLEREEDFLKFMMLKENKTDTPLLAWYLNRKINKSSQAQTTQSSAL